MGTFLSNIRQITHTKRLIIGLLVATVGIITEPFQSHFVRQDPGGQEDATDRG
jgi:hypothetical protein